VTERDLHGLDYAIGGVVSRHRHNQHVRQGGQGRRRSRPGSPEQVSFDGILALDLDAMFKGTSMPKGEVTVEKNVIGPSGQEKHGMQTSWQRGALPQTKPEIPIRRRQNEYSTNWTFSSSESAGSAACEKAREPRTAAR